MDQDQRTAAGRYSALVRGPSPTFPRGAGWLFGFLFAAVLWASLFLLPDRPLWSRLAVPVCYGFALVYLALRFRTAVQPAFSADGGGLWLGRETGSADRRRVAWDEIRELRISPAPHGPVLEIMLAPGRPATSLLAQLARLPLILMPGGYRRTLPALLIVWGDPLRFRVPLAAVTPDELASSLSAFAPAALPVVTAAAAGG